MVGMVPWTFRKWTWMILPRSQIFFLQAEDGIRDTSVTGVQTCALPICSGTRLPADHRHQRDGLQGAMPRHEHSLPTRSEERRVGKECRFRWPGDDEEEKTEGVADTLLGADVDVEQPDCAGSTEYVRRAT